MRFQTTKQDALLVVRCQLSEPGALDELVDRWHGPVSSYVGRMLSGTDAAEETIQDLWLRVLRALPRLKDPKKFGPWLFRIARFAAMDHLRRRYRSFEQDIEPDQVAVAPKDLNLSFQIAELESALARLEPPEREAVALFYLDDWTVRQIAEFLEIPDGTVKSRLFRARRQLRSILVPVSTE